MRRPTSLSGQAPGQIWRDITRRADVLQVRGVLSVIAARLRRSTPALAGTLVVAIVIVGLGLLPARTWLAQNEAIEQSRADLAEAEAELSRLEAELDLLQTVAEVERQARQNFDLVYPGEESYRILPAPKD